MPYIETEMKARIRQIRNGVVPYEDALTDELLGFEVQKEDFYWLMEKVEKLAKLEETEQ